MWLIKKKSANPSFGWIKCSVGASLLRYLVILIMWFEKSDKRMFTICSTLCFFEHTVYFSNESIVIQGFIIWWWEKGVITLSVLCVSICRGTVICANSVGCMHVCVCVCVCVCVRKMQDLSFVWFPVRFLCVTYIGCFTLQSIS